MSLDFSKNSWHLKFVRKMTNYYTWDEESNNICAYTRAFIFAVLKTAFLATFAVGIGALLFWIMLIPLAAATTAMVCNLFHLVYPHWITIDKRIFQGDVMWGALGGIAVGIAIVLGALYARRKYHDYRRENPLPARAPSVLVTMYDNWHDKTCAKIEWK